MVTYTRQQKTDNFPISADKSFNQQHFHLVQKENKKQGKNGCLWYSVTVATQAGWKPIGHMFIPWSWRQQACTIHYFSSEFDAFKTLIMWKLHTFCFHKLSIIKNLRWPLPWKWGMLFHCFSGYVIQTSVTTTRLCFKLE